MSNARPICAGCRSLRRGRLAAPSHSVHTAHPCGRALRARKAIWLSRTPLVMRSAAAQRAGVGQP